MVNPAIAMGVQQLQLPDPLAQYGKLAAIQQAQNQNALAQYQLGAAQRAEAQQNALSAAYQQAYNPETGQVDANRLRQVLATGGFGSQIPAVEKGLLELQNLRLGQQKTQGEITKQQSDLVESRLKQSRAFLDTLDPTDPNAPELYMQWHRANHRDDVLGPLLKARGVTEEQSMARIQQAISQGPQAFAQLINQSKLGTEKFMELNKPTTTTVNRGGQVDVLQTPGLGGKPTTVGAYADVPLPEDVAAQQAQLRAAGASRNVTVLPPQPKSEQEARGKLLVKGYETISDAARIATRSLPALETQERVIDAGFRTGFGAAAQTEAARFLSALGVENAKEYAKNSEGFSAAASQAVLQRQLEQKGVQTEADAQRISQTGAQLGNTPEGNKFIISVARAQFKNDIAQRNFYDAWWKKNGTYDGAEDAWYAGPGSKSLFDAPELKKYAAPKAAPGNRPSLQSIFK